MDAAYGLFIGWIIGFFILVALVIWLLARFVSRDSLANDEQFVRQRNVTPPLAESDSSDHSSSHLRE